ncbi:MAG: OmpA family protein [Cytophagaceae bacterium]|nr:OmpA family protein [Cytophagaceae bacterium]
MVYLLGIIRTVLLMLALVGLSSVLFTPFNSPGPTPKRTPSPANTKTRRPQRPDPNSLNARLRQAHAYRLAQSPLAERVYENLLHVSPDPKLYLYYAQSLALNGKFRESQRALEEYHVRKPALRSTQAYFSRKVVLRSPTRKSRFLPPITDRYRVEYLNINSEGTEFSPTYYRRGLVFCAGRRDASQRDAGRSSYLDLYYLPDLGGLHEGGPPPGSLRKLGSGTSEPRLGTDQYSPATANDSRKVGTYEGTRIATGQGYGDDDPRGADPQRTNPGNEPLDFSRSINTKYHEGPATFTKDGRRIVFTRNNFNNGDLRKSIDNVNKQKLYTAEEKSGAWSAARELPFNSDEYSTGHPTFSPDDQLLYFASDRPGGFGGNDIYVAEFRNGQWSAPANLGRGVNGRGNELFPFIDPAGNLYFASDGHPGLGGLDLFFVEMNNAVPVGKIINLGAPLNSTKDDFGILTDGERREGFISSNRKRGDDDIYRFVREKGEEACRYLTLTVVDADDQTPLDSVAVTLETRSGRTETRSTVGGRVELCLDRNQDYLFHAERSGYQSNLIGFSTRGTTDNQSSSLEIPVQKNLVVAAPPVDSLSDTPANTAGTMGKTSSGVSKLRGVVRGADTRPLEGVIVTLRSDCGGPVQRVVTGLSGAYEFFTINGCDYTLEATKVEYRTKTNRIRRPTKKTTVAKVINTDLSLWREGDAVAVDNIYHNYGQMAIRPDAARELDKLVATLKKNPQMVIELRSHTDSRGDAENNRIASQRRANLIVDYLAARGIARLRMKAMGYGESMPVNECRDGVTCTEAEYQKNRRTEFKIIRLK